MQKFPTRSESPSLKYQAIYEDSSADWKRKTPPAGSREDQGSLTNLKTTAREEEAVHTAKVSQKDLILKWKAGAYLSYIII